MVVTHWEFKMETHGHQIDHRVKTYILKNQKEGERSCVTKVAEYHSRYKTNSCFEGISRGCAY